MSTALLLYRRTAAAWTSVNPTLPANAVGMELDTGLYKIGDGSNGWSALPYEVVLPILGGGESIDLHSSATGATSLDLQQGNVFDLHLTGNVTLSMSNALRGACSFTVIARQDATGSRTITWMSGTKWAGGTAPTISTGANKVDIFSFLTVDGGTTNYGFASGIDLR